MATFLAMGGGSKGRPKAQQSEEDTTLKTTKCIQLRWTRQREREHAYGCWIEGHRKVSSFLDMTRGG